MRMLPTPGALTNLKTMCHAKALCSRGMLRGVMGEREAQKPSRTRNTGPRSIVVASPTGEVGSPV